MSGHWVSPQQLEEALLRCAGVAMAAAIPIVTDEGLTRLRAFVVLEPRCAARQSDWVRACESTLEAVLTPRALRPDRIEVVSSLPTTPSGKLLRRFLSQSLTAGTGPKVVTGTSHETHLGACTSSSKVALAPTGRSWRVAKNSLAISRAVSSAFSLSRFAVALSMPRI